jgi:glycosyltransferase involved in cell wall biosynthesis
MMVAPARRPVTVCHVLHSLKVGGAEVLAARLARRLSGDFRVLFACLDELGTLGQQLRDDGFPVEVLGRRPGVDWRCVLRLARLLRRERVDLVQAHQYTPFFYAAAARLLAPRAAVLLTEHGRHQPDYPRPKRKVANRLLLRPRDRVVAVGAAVREALVANDGFPARRVEVIYNGIDLGPFAAPRDDRRAVRREMGVGDGEFVILQVARLDYLKDHATAVRTLARVLPHRPEARLVLVGEGPELGAIRDAVRRDGVEAQVRFLGLRKDVARLLSAADLFLLTSTSEGIPLTVIEAMAAGLPVVATRVGGTAEVVADGVTGLLAPARDAERLAAHVLALAADPAARGAMGGRGRARAAEVFAEPLMHDGYRRVYQEMLSR